MLRRGPHRTVWSAAAWAMAAVTAASALVACGSAASHRARPGQFGPDVLPPAAASASASTRQPLAPAPLDALLTVLRRIRVPGRAWQVLAANGTLFTSGGYPGTVITRVDPATGHVGPSTHVTHVAGITFGAGLLWVVRGQPAKGAPAPSLVALSPATLRVRHTVRLPERPGWGSEVTAYAGGLIWVAGRRSLIAIDPATATLARRVPAVTGVGAGGFVSVAASAGGTSLWTAEGSPGGGPIAVQLRDPRTGGVLAASKDIAPGVAGAQIAAALDHAWLAVPTGLEGGYVQAVRRAGQLVETPPAKPRRREIFANGIQVYLASRRLWIIDGMSGSIACANASTGRILAAVRNANIDVSDIAPAGAGRLALPVNGDLLIAAPKPPCTP